MSPTQTISAAATDALTKAGVPVEKHAEKMRSLRWYIPAAFLLLMALVFSGVGVYYAFTHELSLLVVIVLLVPTGLCLLGALLCATQADREGLTAAISAIGSLVKLGRGA